MSNVTSFQNLPNELRFQIISFLDMKDLFRLRSVDQSLNLLVEDYFRIALKRIANTVLREVPGPHGPLSLAPLWGKRKLTLLQIKHPSMSHPLFFLNHIYAQIHKLWRSNSYDLKYIPQKTYLDLKDYSELHEAALIQENSVQNLNLLIAWPGLRDALLDSDVPDTPGRRASLRTVRAFLNRANELNLLTDVNRINLSQMGLTAIPNEIGYFRTLRELHLTNNQIKRVPPLFLPELRALYIHSNQLTTLPILHSPMLSVLFLGDNAIRKIAEVPYPLLQILDLPSNQLTHVPTFITDNLSLLDLDYNRLSSLPLVQTGQLKIFCNPIFLERKDILPSNEICFKNFTRFFGRQREFFMGMRMPRGINGIAALYCQLIDVETEISPPFFLKKIGSELITLYEYTPLRDQELIQEMAGLLSDPTESFSLHSINNAKFYAAVHNAILKKYDRLTKSEQMEIAKIIAKNDRTKCTRRTIYNTSNAKRNALKLAIALMEFEKSSSQAVSSTN